MPSTRPLPHQTTAHVKQFHVEVLMGPRAGEVHEPDLEGVLRIGRGATETTGWLSLADETVSQLHLVLEAEAGGVRLHERSSNGTAIGGLFVHRVTVTLRATTTLRVGETTLRVVMEGADRKVPTTSSTRFGALSGTSTGMRRAFSRAELIARNDVPVLILGEPGTGKTALAKEIHQRSKRAKHPMLTVDCTTLVDTLLASQLFGHRKGAFAGADADRAGVFEEAKGGTVFLDEFGELSPLAQASLLRVLGERVVQRVGEVGRDRSVDVRVIAATNRDLRQDVNDKRFRRDLYDRMEVGIVELPPLRERLDELDGLINTLIDAVRADQRVTVSDDFVLPADVRAAMRSRQWRGNVRELIHFLECFMLFGEVPLESAVAGQDAGRVIPIHDLLGMKSEPALTALRHRFDRIYLPHIIKEAGGVVNAARVREVDRATLWRRMRECGLRPRREGEGPDER